MKHPAPIIHVVTFLLCLAFGLGVPGSAYAQVPYQVAPGGASSMRISGTSTLHPWTMESTTVAGTAELLFASGSDGDWQGLKSLTFALPVRSLKSNHKGLDNNAYEALRADQHPSIHYRLSSATCEDRPGGYLLRTRGQLTVAGTTRDIAMEVLVDIKPDKSISCKGSYTLNMQDYGVTPPSFMLGVMKTGEIITLDFDVAYLRAAKVRDAATSLKNN
ncbi:polyisoprenoid-binding protein YceI [Lewinella marina]|uniref:Lipid/polyisoprenoid-binding YceI-like domain-containing protein n=1 Tax=Neolewinella marina TaxID=438751 RepID=A0A2G0CBA5_9BACT|nr:YceI family protein [Neolewinella marina]NJB87732.1 polyisoprenoid-binding protein YceI [Neolewinella marina]PHK97207.1 hypothetical protein CGL56_16630 [Neolewinella marina]